MVWFQHFTVSSIGPADSRLVYGEKSGFPKISLFHTQKYEGHNGNLIFVLPVNTVNDRLTETKFRFCVIPHRFLCCGLSSSLSRLSRQRRDPQTTSYSGENGDGDVPAAASLLQAL